MKKFIALTMSSTLSILLAACGGSAVENGSSESNERIKSPELPTTESDPDQDSASDDSDTPTESGDQDSPDSEDDSVSREMPLTNEDQPRIAVQRIDFDNNGIFEGEAIYSYNQIGQLERIDYTYTDDGTEDSEFDSRPNPFGFGGVDRIMEVTFNSDGNIATLNSGPPLDDGDRELDVARTGGLIFENTWGSPTELDSQVITAISSSGEIQVSSTSTLIHSDDRLVSYTTVEVFFGEQTITTNGSIDYSLGATTPFLEVRLETLGAGVGVDVNISRFNFIPDGRIDTAVFTSVGSDFVSMDEFSYAEQQEGGVPEGALISEVNSSSARATPFVRTFSCTDGLVTSVLFRGESRDGSLREAVATLEYEMGPCAPTAIWVPRSRANFLPTGSDPLFPGTGYARSACSVTPQ